MHNELSVRSNPLADLVSSRLARVAAWLRAPGIVLGGTILMAVCARLALPLYFTPVPLTLAPFAVLLLGLLLTPRLAFATLAAYLAEGALGLPVFAPSPMPSSGLAHLLGPTGGYLIAYPLAAWLISSLWRRSGGGFTAAAFSTALGDLTILSSGAFWLGILTHVSPQAAVKLAVLPFFPGDALKVVAAAALATGFQRLCRRSA